MKKGFRLKLFVINDVWLIQPSFETETEPVTETEVINCPNFV